MGVVKRSVWRIVCVSVIGLIAGCAVPQGASVQDKRADVEAMEAQALATIFAAQPQLKQVVAAAPGYGVFSGMTTQTLYVASGHGYGVIQDNTTGRRTYMRVAKLGGGLGVGVEDVRALVVFTDASTMNSVIRQGWTASGKAGASVGAQGSGASAFVVAELPGMTIYRFTRSGASVGGSIAGVRLWQDPELN